MTKLEGILYAAQAQTTGGRENGVSRASDGRFVAGWPTCFLSAIKTMAAKRIEVATNVVTDVPGSQPMHLTGAVQSV